MNSMTWALAMREGDWLCLLCGLCAAILAGMGLWFLAKVVRAACSSDMTQKKP